MEDVPIDVPIDGPTDVPIDVPTDVPIDGPIDSPIGGPIGGPISGPVDGPKDDGPKDDGPIGVRGVTPVDDTPIMGAVVGPGGGISIVEGALLGVLEKSKPERG